MSQAEEKKNVNQSEISKIEELDNDGNTSKTGPNTTRKRKTT
jgi:hypothetical protein